MVPSPNLINLSFCFQAYFCGPDPHCLDVRSNRAYEQARENMIKHFPVVVLIEDYEKSLKV